ncbi:hypothetical protein [Enterococcus phage MDA2]|uniref:Uncharacterized protein n=1 Tax=Enterococcus phage MDA2 TaxID=2816459 RepID=A0AAE7UWU0_9CAUD|nr:hypothetical protein [Enterococcus phage MDA2]
MFDCHSNNFLSLSYKPSIQYSLLFVNRKDEIFN